VHKNARLCPTDTVNVVTSSQDIRILQPMLARHPAPGEGVQGHDGDRRGGRRGHGRRKKKDETAADLALIGAAQKVEHYEMSGYITARNLVPTRRV
jgi:Mn-containing catalase